MIKGENAIFFDLIDLIWSKNAVLLATRNSISLSYFGILIWKKNLKGFECCICKRVGISTTSVTSQHCIFSPNKVNKIKEYCVLPFNHVWCLPWLPILLTSSSCLVCPQLCISMEQCQLNWIKIQLTSKVVIQLVIKILLGL